jgi:hypothetical protein
MRTIKLLTITALVLLILAGPASYGATYWIDGNISNGALFALAWIFSGLGIMSNAVLLGSLLNDDSFGKPAFLKTLFDDGAGTLLVLSIAVAIIGGMVVAVNDYGVETWGIITVGYFAGCAICFLIQLFAVMDETWIGEHSGSVSRISRRAS